MRKKSSTLLGAHRGILYASDEGRNQIIGKFAKSENERITLQGLLGRGLGRRKMTAVPVDLDIEIEVRTRPQPTDPPPGPKISKVYTTQFMREMSLLHRIVSGQQMSVLFNAQDAVRAMAERVEYFGLDLSPITPAWGMDEDEIETLQEIQECVTMAVGLLAFDQFVLAIKHASSLISGICPSMKSRLRRLSIAYAPTLEERAKRCRGAGKPLLVEKRGRKPRRSLRRRSSRQH